MINSKNIPFYKFNGKEWKSYEKYEGNLFISEFSVTFWNILFQLPKIKIKKENLEKIEKGIQFSEEEVKEIDELIHNDLTKKEFKDFLESKNIERKLSLFIIKILEKSFEKTLEYIESVPKKLLGEAFKIILLYQISNETYFKNNKFCKDFGKLFHYSIEQLKKFDIIEAVSIFSCYQISYYTQGYLMDHEERFKHQANELKELNSDVIILCEFQIVHLKYLMEQEWVKNNYFLSDITFDGKNLENFKTNSLDFSIMLTKLPFQSAHLIVDRWGEGKAYVQLKLWNDISIFGLHLMAFDQYQETRMNQLRDVISLSDKFIIGGDFNIHNDIDEENLKKLDILDFKDVYPKDKEYITFDGTQNSLIEFIYLYAEKRKMALDRIISSKNLNFKPEFLKLIGTKEYQFGRLNTHLSDHYGLYTVLKEKK